MRSVYIGCPRYSRRWRLLVALSFHRVIERVPAQGHRRRNSALGCGAFNPFLDNAAASLRFRVLWSCKYASQLIQR